MRGIGPGTIDDLDLLQTRTSLDKIGHRRLDRRGSLFVSSEALERDGGGGVGPVHQQGEPSDRLKPQYGGNFGGGGDGCAASLHSSGENMRARVVEPLQRQATAAAIQRWSGSPPSSLTMRTFEALHQQPQHVKY